MRDSPPNPASSPSPAHAEAPQAPSSEGGAWPGGRRAIAAGLARFAHPASLLLLAAATFAAFAGVLRNEWVLFDDPEYVLANPRINQGITWLGLRWVLHSAHGANFHPLTSVLHMLDVQLFGLNPAGHHAVSLVLHVLNGVLLAIALSRLTGAWWKSLLVAALFAVHPLRVESVAWASELKDVLSGLFFMLTLWAYAGWVERPGWWRQARVIAFLGLGLLAKPMLVTLPCLLVLLDVWPLGRLRGGPPPAAGRRVACGAPQRALTGLVAEKWPMFLLAVASSLTTFLVQRTSGAMAPTQALPLATRAVNASLSYWRYLGATVWPRGLLPFYHLDPTHTAFERGTLAALALAAVTALALWQARRRPQVLVGWLWYVGTLVPVIGLVQVGMQSHADRYTYLTIIGVLITAVWIVAEFWPRTRAAHVAAAVVACAVLAVSGVATSRQVAKWRSSRVLFSYTLARDPANYDALNIIGTELLQTGHTRESIPYFEKALHYSPGFNDARLNLGNALSALGRYDEGVANYLQIIRTQDGARVRHNLGLTLMKQGRTDEAIADYQAALRFDPDHYPSLVELAAAQGIRNRMSEAETALRHAVELEPTDDRVRRLLAVTLTNEDDVEAAIEQYRILVRRNPDDLDALNNIAWIRATHADPRHRDGAEAVQFAERAQTRSKEPVAALYSTLAAAYAEAGRFPEAVQAGVRATELARAERDSLAGVRFAQQLACYRSGRPFHFGQ
jgi:protein O-mannosyl-transferase